MSKSFFQQHACYNSKVQFWIIGVFLNLGVIYEVLGPKFCHFHFTPLIIMIIISTRNLIIHKNLTNLGLLPKSDCFY